MLLADLVDASTKVGATRSRKLKLAALADVLGRVGPDDAVEIALDGVLASDRYPGGVSLRFARVRRYRPDKTPAGADDIATVRTLRPGSG